MFLVDQTQNFFFYHPSPKMSVLIGLELVFFPPIVLVWPVPKKSIIGPAVF